MTIKNAKHKYEISIEWCTVVEPLCGGGWLEPRGTLLLSTVGTGSCQSLVPTYCVNMLFTYDNYFKTLHRLLIIVYRAYH